MEYPKKEASADVNGEAKEGVVHGVNEQSNHSKKVDGAQAPSAAERLFECGGIDLLDAGLRAAKRGWKIFPCDNRKHPLVKWSEEATTDGAQIRAWAKQYPGAVWGRALEDDVVIDLDMKYGKNGIREFERLQGCKPEDFTAPRVATPTGGTHVYTDPGDRDYKGVVDKIAIGIDTRTSGNLVLIPSGPQTGYRWLSDPNTPRPPTPSWADAALRRNTNLEAMAEAKPFQGVSP